MSPHHSDNSPVQAPLKIHELDNAADPSAPTSVRESQRSTDVCAWAVSGDNAPLASPKSVANAPPEHEMAAFEAKQAPSEANEPPPKRPDFPWLKSLATGTLIMCAILGLVIMGQISSILIVLTSLLAPLRIPVDVTVALIVLIALIVLAMLLAKPIWAIMKLRANPVNAVSALRAIIGLKDVQRAVYTRDSKAKERVQTHLRAYFPGRNQDKDKNHQEDLLVTYLRNLGCSEENVEQARLNWSQVHSDDALEVTTDSFFKRVDDWMNTLRNGCSDNIIDRYARNVALATAISPNPLLDSIIVVVCAVRMVGDLCKLFNLRIGGASVAVLAGYLCVQAYTARRGQDIGDIVADTIKGTAVGKPPDDAITSVMETVAEVGSKVLGKVTALGVEAGVNYLLMRRLGRTVVQFLAPK